MTSQNLREMGFQGFVKVQDLMKDISCVPDRKGVYAIIRFSTGEPRFLKVGTGGHFKNKEPNVLVSELEKNWLDDTDILYIGKAGSLTGDATLRSRLYQYMQFGQGYNVGHWGGRYIWQLADRKSLMVCWLPTLHSQEPEVVEKGFIQDFKLAHHGNRPFANLRD